MEARARTRGGGGGREAEWGRRRRREREEGTSTLYRRSLVQDFYPAELRRNLWMPFPYPQDTNSTLPTRLLSFYRSYIPRRNGCPQSAARAQALGENCPISATRDSFVGFSLIEIYLDFKMYRSLSDFETLIILTINTCIN